MFTMTQKTQKLLPKSIIDFLAIKRVGGELELQVQVFRRFGCVVERGSKGAVWTNHFHRFLLVVLDRIALVVLRHFQLALDLLALGAIGQLEHLVKVNTNVKVI